MRHEDGTFTDAWGIRFQQAGPYVHAAESPLRGMPTLKKIDNEGTTVDDVREQVRVCVDQLAPGGGYILTTCNHMIDVQPELVEALFDAAHEYGRYA